MTFDLQAWASTARADLDGYLSGLFTDAWPSSFSEPLRYPVFGGGKRMRPLLVMAAYEALGGGDRNAALPAAAAIELVHTYSLVHDDLPCMDDDDERRGRPTVHRAYDEATAVLVGDALLTEAFDQLTRAPLTADVRIAMVRLVAGASGYLGMIGGQVGDVALGASIQDVDTLQRVHQLKTGRLIEASVQLGGLAAYGDGKTRSVLQRYGRNVGLAFQLIDDILDADEDAGDEGPPSYVRLLGLDETRRQAHAMVDEACELVAHFPAPEALQALARFTVQRDV